MRRAVQRILEDSISDAVMKNFLEAGDEATFDLDEGNPDECGVDGMRSYFVTIRRARDEKELRVEVEESCRDMVVELDDDTQEDTEPEINGAEPAIMKKQFKK